MLKKELVKYLQPFPDDAEIFTEIKQDIHLDCDDWSHRVTASIDECFEIAGITTVSGYDGDTPRDFVVLIAGKAV